MSKPCSDKRWIQPIGMKITGYVKVEKTPESEERMQHFIEYVAKMKKKWDEYEEDEHSESDVNER